MILSNCQWFKKLCLFAVASVLPITAFAAPEERQAEENFVVGMASGYAPYVSLNAKGEYEGFDIDLANLLADRLHRKLVLKDLGSMTSLRVAIQKKKIDAIMWAMSITEDRQKEMEMVYYQGEKVTEMPFVFWKEVPKGIAKIDDLAKLPNCTVCVEAGSSQDAALQKYPNLKIKYLDKITDAMMEIKCRKALTTTIDNSLVNLIQSQYPDIKIINLPLPEDQHTLGNGICLNKESKELAGKVQKCVAELIAEGKVAELEKKWGLAK
jgi:polar amino acid transport system substrate-binding protein